MLVHLEKDCQKMRFRCPKCESLFTKEKGHQCDSVFKSKIDDLLAQISRQKKDFEQKLVEKDD